MFYEPDKPKKKKRRRSSCLGRLVKFGLVLAALYIVVTMALTSTVSGIFSGLVPDGLPGGWRNVLLMGSDRVGGGAARTDTMIVASISTGGQVKLTSIMRDTLVPIDGHGRQKINAAYTYGGAQLAMDTVNAMFGLNIKQYALIDFEGFAQLVDAVGGIEIDITKAEQQAMNKKKGHKLKEYGEKVHLDGIQALRYARIRKIDSDYMRASRQRTVIEALMAKVRSGKNPAQLVELGRRALEVVQTNIAVPDLVLLGGRVLLHGGGISQFRVPAEGTYDSGTVDGVWSIRPDFEKNKALLRKFIYG